jgi:tRNA(Ile)-lysidine synthase TilS/MesJ
VGLSGGKDSTYALYRLVTHYGLRAEAFTYVHDGTAEFSLNNAVETCRRLGVVHHIVSLKGSSHLETFKGYFQAWQKHPSAVSAGMTCVACKHLHILGSGIAKKREIPLYSLVNQSSGILPLSGD